MKLERFHPTETELEEYTMLRNANEHWRSVGGTYLVSVNHVAGFVHVRIAHRNLQPINEGWYFFQEIKNQVLGENVVAVQVYPREKDLVDGSNTYHLWTSTLLGVAAPNLKQMERYH
jgi:hypothetical protein